MPPPRAAQFRAAQPGSLGHLEAHEPMSGGTTSAPYHTLLPSLRVLVVQKMIFADIAPITNVSFARHLAYGIMQKPQCTIQFVKVDGEAKPVFSPSLPQTFFESCINAVALHRTSPHAASLSDDPLPQDSLR